MTFFPSTLKKYTCVIRTYKRTYMIDTNACFSGQGIQAQREKGGITLNLGENKLMAGWQVSWPQAAGVWGGGGAWGVQADRIFMPHR